MSTFGKVCMALVLVPVAFVIVTNSLPDSQARADRPNSHVELKQAADRAQQADELKALKEERDTKLRAVGLDSVPDVTVSSVADMRKQMRIEGMPADQDIVEVFQDASAQIDAVKPLEQAAAAVKLGKEDDVQILNELAGVKKGDAITEVMEKFDAPDNRGETNEVLKYSQGWPDMMYYSYDLADVTFLVSQGNVETILVGLAYPEASR